MSAFKGRKLPFAKLFVNGLNNISSAGLTDILSCCKETLTVFEAGLMNQDAMTGHFCSTLATCFNLTDLDLTGDVNIGDDGFSQLSKGEIKIENTGTTSSNN